MYSTEGTFAHQGEPFWPEGRRSADELEFLGSRTVFTSGSLTDCVRSCRATMRNSSAWWARKEVEVLDYGMVDSVENGREALEKCAGTIRTFCCAIW